MKRDRQNDTPEGREGTLDSVASERAAQPRVLTSELNYGHLHKTPARIGPLPFHHRRGKADPASTLGEGS